MKEYVLDANAVIRFLEDTPGVATVDRLIGEARRGRAHISMSSINLGEAYYVLGAQHGEEIARSSVAKAKQAITMVPADDETALAAAAIKLRYKLGYADSFAAELALRIGATLVTADPDFARLGKQLKVLALPRHSA